MFQPISFYPLLIILHYSIPVVPMREPCLSSASGARREQESFKFGFGRCNNLTTTTTNNNNNNNNNKQQQQQQQTTTTTTTTTTTNNNNKVRSRKPRRRQTCAKRAVRGRESQGRYHTVKSDLALRDPSTDQPKVRYPGLYAYQREISQQQSNSNLLATATKKRYQN